MERLRWVFELIDKMSGPASKAGTSLGNLGGALGRTTQAGTYFDSNVGKWRNGLGQFTGAAQGSLGAVGALKSGFEAVGSAISSMATYLTGMVLALGVATTAFVGLGIEQTKFQENTLMSFKVMSGLGLTGDASNKYAQNKLMRGVAFAQYTPLDTKEALVNSKKLASNFTDKQSEDISALGGDLMTLGLSKDNIQHMMLAFNQIKAAGVLRGQDMLQIDSSIGEVISRENLGAAIGKMKGVDAKTGASMLGGGTLTSDEFFQALFKATLTKTGMKQAGELSARQSGNSLTGSISNLTGRADEIFLTAGNLSKLTGVRQLKAAIDSTSDALNTMNGQERRVSGSGRMLQDSVVGAFDKILQVVAGDELFQGDRPQKMVESLAVGFGMLGDVVTVVAKGVLGFVDGITTGLGLGKEFMGGPFDPNKVANLGEMFRNLGKTLGEMAAKFLKTFEPVISFIDKMTSADFTPTGLAKTLGGGLLDLGKAGMMGMVDPLGITSGIANSIFGSAPQTSAGADNSKTQTNNVTINYSAGTAQDHVDAANDMADKVTRRIPNHLTF